MYKERYRRVRRGKRIKRRRRGGFLPFLMPLLQPLIKGVIGAVSHQ